MLKPRGWHSRGYLPHYDDGASLQVIGYRLADALPASVWAKMEEQRLDDATRRLEMDHYLGAGHGSAILRDVACADAVVESWRHFDGTRYWLHAWVVMPNHVHVLIAPTASATIPAIVQSWKSYTAKVILRHAGAGMFPDHRIWQPDYHDRFIRNERHYAAVVEYVHQNPVKAGLVARPEEWAWSSAREWERGRLARRI